MRILRHDKLTAFPLFLTIVIFCALSGCRGWPNPAPAPSPTPTFTPAPSPTPNPNVRKEYHPAYGLSFIVKPETVKVGEGGYAFAPVPSPSYPRRENWELVPRTAQIGRGLPVVPEDVQEWIVHDYLEGNNEMARAIAEGTLNEEILSKYATGEWKGLGEKVLEAPTWIALVEFEVPEERYFVYSCPKERECILGISLPSSTWLPYKVGKVVGEPVKRPPSTIYYLMVYEDGRWKVAKELWEFEEKGVGK